MCRTPLPHARAHCQTQLPSFSPLSAPTSSARGGGTWAQHIRVSVSGSCWFLAPALKVVVFVLLTNVGAPPRTQQLQMAVWSESHCKSHRAATWFPWGVSDLPQTHPVANARAPMLRACAGGCEPRPSRTLRLAAAAPLAPCAWHGATAAAAGNRDRSAILGGRAAARLRLRRRPARFLRRQGDTSRSQAVASSTRTIIVANRLLL